MKYITSATAKQVLKICFETGEMPTEIVERLNLWAIDDKDTLLNIVKRVLEDNPTMVSKYKSGTIPILSSLLGLCIKATEGRGEPSILKTILEQELN